MPESEMRSFTEEEFQVVMPAHIKVAGELLTSRAAGTRHPRIAARVANDLVRLRIVDFAPYAPVFDGRLVPDGDATILRGRLRMGALARAQLTAGAIFLTMFFAILGYGVVSTGVPDGSFNRLVIVLTALAAIAGLSLLWIRLLTQRTGEPLRQFVASMSTPADTRMPERRPWRGVAYWLGAYGVLLGVSSLDSVTGGAYRPVAITIAVLAEIAWYYAYRRFTRIRSN
jgi:hypothetical protein